MDIIEPLNWRYAVKQFDPTKKIPEAELDTLLEALRLSPSSYGLQPWKFIVISDPALKEELKTHSFNQAQATDCSHLLVLCRINEVTEEYIDHFLEPTAEAKGVPVEKLEGYKAVIVGDLIDGPRSKIIDQWASRQVYLALGNLLTSAAAMGIDACPMEGFVPAEYDQVLGLAEKGLSSVVVCALGYRSEDDKYAKIPKVRFEADEVIEKI